MDVDSAVYPLSFEELTILLIKDTTLKFPFVNTATGMTDLHSLSSRFERPAFAYLFRWVKRAILWFLSLVDGSGQVLFCGRSKVDLKIMRPTDGLYIRLAGRTVQRCQLLYVNSIAAGRFADPAIWPGRRDETWWPRRHCSRCAAWTPKASAI